MHLVKLLSFGCWGLACAFASEVKAVEPTIPYEVRATGNAECAPAAFAAKIAVLSSRLRPAQSGEAALDFFLEIAKTERVFNGRLRVRELDGNETTRAITGVSCDEVLTALALIAAVLIDPNATPRPADIAPQRVESSIARRGPVAVGAGFWQFAAGVGAGVETAVGPEIVPTVSFQGETALLGRGILSPRLALAVHRAAGSTVATLEGSAHFRWTAARTSACPVRFSISDRLALRPCLFFDLGVLDATGQQTYRGASAQVTWYALGALARAEYVPFAPLSIGLDGGILVPLVQDTFYFDPKQPSETLEIPRLGLNLRLGLAVYFE